MISIFDSKYFVRSYKEFLGHRDTRNESALLTSPFIEVNVSNINQATFCCTVACLCTTTLVLLRIMSGKVFAAGFGRFVVIDIQVGS